MHDRPDAKHHFFFAAIDLAVVLGRMPELLARWAGREIVFRGQAEALLAPFRHLIGEVSLRLPQRARGMRVALDSLVLEASRLLETGEAGPSAEIAPVFCHPGVLRAKEMKEHQPGERWRLDDLARRAGLSSIHLAECFTRDVGVAPHQYLLQLRIKQAQEMLRQSDIPITELALELGFSSGQHFAGTFKKMTSQTPQQYRRQAR